MNKNACSEVYQVLQYLPEVEYKKIPKEKIQYLKNSMNKDYKKICSINTKIEDIELSEEAMEIFLSLFYNYIANNVQKTKLENFLTQRNKENEDKFKSENLFNNISKTNYTKINNIEKENSLIQIDEKSIIYQIKKVFSKILAKFGISKKM